MKILIVSDSHGHNENLIEILHKNSDCDMVIHCGDAEGAEDIIKDEISCPLYIVAGNNDFFSQAQMETEFNIGKYKVLLTHGHYYGVNMGTERLVDEARARGVDIVMYGHTHRPKMKVNNGITVINPGSISYPRQNGKVPTYMIMEMDESENLFFTLCYYDGRKAAKC